jgi:hypothetical protein
MLMAGKRRENDDYDNNITIVIANKSDSNRAPAGG